MIFSRSTVHNGEFARALLTSPQAGTTHYIDADVRDPDTILHEARRLLDITQPVGLVLMGILGYIADFDEARRIVAQLLDGLPAGSALIYYDGTNTHQEMVQANRHYANSGAVPYQVRSPEQLRTVFDGLNLIEPGRSRRIQRREPSVCIRSRTVRGSVRGVS